MTQIFLWATKNNHSLMGQAVKWCYKLKKMNAPYPIQYQTYSKNWHLTPNKYLHVYQMILSLPETCSWLYILVRRAVNQTWMLSCKRSLHVVHFIGSYLMLVDTSDVFSLAVVICLCNDWLLSLIIAEKWGLKFLYYRSKIYWGCGNG